MGVMDRYNEKKKKEQNTSNSAFASGGVMQRYNLYKTIGNVDYDVNEDFINTFITDANSFLESAEKDYGSVGWGNASSSYDSRYNSWKDIYSRSVAIRRWIDNNRRNLDEDTYNSLSEALTSYNSGVSSTLDAFKNAKDYFGQWETEDAYNTYAAEQEWLKSDDFKANSQYVSTVSYAPLGKPEFGDKTYEYINNQTIKDNRLLGAGEKDARYFIESEHDIYSADNKFDNGESFYEERGYDLLEPDEVSIYNYYYNTQGSERAQEYLDSIQNILSYRKAGKIVERIGDSNVLAILFAAEAGLDQFKSGIGNIDNFFMGTEADPTSATQYASSMLREKLDGGWGVAYDAISTTANMLPSILVSAIPVVGKPLGLATMGTSAIGNAYSEMKNLGYDDWQSRGYAALVGASEMVLQSLLGGISKLGGSHSASAAVSKLVSKVDNAFAKVAIKLGGNMASEGLEEAIQTALEPAFKALMTGEQFEGAEWDEILYSALLGALSAGVMEGAPTIYSTAKSNIGAKKIYGDGKDLVAEGLEIGGDAGALAEKYQKNRIDKSKNLTGSQINHLIAANEQVMKTNDTGKIKSAVEARLTELGEKGNASALADVITKHRSGGKLTRAEKQMLRESTYGRRVSNEANPDYIKSGGYSSEWATKIGTDRINDDVYNPAPEQGKTLTPGDIKLKEFASAGEPPETKFEVSESGETTVGGEKVDIKEIASIKDGEITLRLDNGETVNANEVEFSSNDEGLLYESAIDMGLNAATANAFVKGYEQGDGLSIQEYVLGFWEAYRYGSYGIPMQEMSRDGLSFVLPEVKRSLAYNLGKTDAKYKITEKQNKVTEAKKAPKTNNASKTKGKLYNTIKPTNERQRASLKALGVLADALGINIHIFESRVDAKGRRIGKNGLYDPKTGDIYIDLYAGQRGESTMLFTASHELTHFIRDWSPAKFKVFADFLFEQYGEKGVSVSDLVRKQIEKAKKRGRTISYDVAYGEVVADACEMMLTDSNAIEVIAKLKAKDKSLWQKIKDFISNLVARITKAYEGMTPNSEEANHVKEMKDAAERLQALWTEALVDAGANYEASIGSRNLEDFADAKNENGEPLFQYRAMEADEDIYREMLQKWGKMSSVQIDNLFTTIDNAMELIKDNLKILDYAWEADIDDRAFSPVKANSDNLYKVSLDFSTLCRKRILQQTIATQLQDALNKPLSREEGIAIRDALIALQEEGRKIEVACALCYVESARMKSPKQIKRFMEDKEQVIKEFFAGKSGGSIKEKIKQAEVDAREKLHKEHPSGIKGKDGETMLDPRNAALGKLPKQYADAIRLAKKTARESYKPTAEEQKLIDVAKRMTVSDFTSPEGLENLAKNYPSLFDAYASFIVNATHSKGIENDTWWRAGDSKNIGDVLIANMNKENGLRSQSWSDFQVIHILDYIASTIELATRNTKEQAYSKVPDYVELMGLTGVMINMSLIPTATFNGSLEYDSVEGIEYRRALELRDKYHATAGTICIGVDDVQIKMLLADTTIDYVIPFHRSGVAAHIRKAMHIPTWAEYQDYQSETKLSKSEAEKQAKKYGVKLLDASDPNYQVGTNFSDWFDLKEAQQIAKMENANPSDKAKQKKYGVMYGGYMAMQNAANNYLKLCAERGLSPKFSHEKADFTAEDNYWKLLIDRKMVDNVTGEVIEQQNIKPIFSEGEVMRILNDELARYPGVKADQEYAIRKVTEKMLSGEIKGGMSAEAIAKVMKKPVDNVTNVNILASAEDMLLSDRDSYAPTFYSHMGKVIDGIKIDKMGANGVVSYLKGKGVKDEEIKWSGIEAFLEGKKSVTKAELQEFVAGSQLQIEEEMSADEENADIELVPRAGGNKLALYIDGQLEDTFTRTEFGTWESEAFGDLFFDKQEILDQVKSDYARNVANTKWSQYKLDGGSNYREIVFKMPNSSHSNQMMRTHWGLDAEGVLAHARIQDFIVNGKKMLFIEEIQSDWHNEGAKDGYVESKDEAHIEGLKAKADEAFIAVENYSVAVTGMAGEWEVIQKTPRGIKLLREYREAKANYDNAMNEFVKKIPDAPFRSTYHEYVLKRLLRMAAEEGYDSIGWTPAEIQDKRWADGAYHEEGKGKSGNLIGYTIEYDQDMPKFLRKYGKKWGATVGFSNIRTTGYDRDYYEEQISDIESEIEQYRDELDDDNTEDYNIFIQEGISDLQNTLSRLYDELRGEKVWSMDITDSMKESVLEEGQPLYSDRDTSSLIGKEMMFYEEGDGKPDLTLVEVYNERTKKTETTIKFVGNKPKDYVPKKIAYCYKLFEQHPDGTLHALFAGASNATPIGEWQYAKGFPYTDSGVKGMNLRERYGWHLSAGLPSAPHLMSSKSFERGYPSKNAFGHPKGSKRVWVRMAYDATTDFNSIADSTKEGDIFGLIPFGGYYAFKENNQSEWVISSAVKIDAILTEPERQQILKEAGYDEYEAWRKKHRATEAEKAENKRKSAENKKAKDKAKKAGLNYLSESSRAMRDAIKSRIIDNPELTDEKKLYSDREVQPVTEAEYETLKKHFGVTANFRVAGYLLTDGKLLDFSGKHWGDSTSRSRQVDHRDVQEVLSRGNNGIYDMVDMIGSGNIRLMPEIGGINLAVYPNEKQRRVLSLYIKQMLATEGQVIIDYDTVGGDTVHSRVYGKYSSSSQILSDIRNYFNGARRSELMDFHTSFSDRDADSFSTRSLLAGALESVAENDIEKSKLKQYKEKIALIESEQKKLSEIRAKAKELRFTKGRTPSETKQMRDLDFEANQIANRINTYDKQLLNLESTKALKNVLEREKQILRKRLEEKGKEALKSYKERAAQTVRELMTRNTESRKKAIEGRHKTEMRNKIKDIVSDLNKLLLNPTKEQHVPIGLQGVVADALDAINMDTMNAEERVAYYNELIAKAKDPDEIATLTKKRDFFAYRDMNFKEKITALKNAYAEFKESDDPLIRNAHNDAIEELIKNTADAVGNKSLKDMSLEQLEAVYDMYKALRATVRNANKMFKEGRQETVTDNSEAVKTEVREVGGHKDRIHKVTKWLKTQGWNMLKPVYAMKMIGSDTFKKLYDNVRAGEDTWAVDVSEAKEFYQEKAKKYNYKSWDFKAQHSFKDSVGNDFSLSLEQIMSLYAYSKREQADKHLEVGGFVFDDVIEVTEKNKLGLPVKYEVNDANPYRLKKEDLGTVIAALTEEQKSFIDEMQTYLSDVMGAKGNEVSLALYDIKLYKEKNYFPLKTAKHFREFDPEKNGTPKIKNSGFSKKTVPQAGNPIVLSNFMDVWATHVNDMSMYHAFVLPLEDFMRVYNYSSTAGGYDSVQQAIKNAYGSGANQYIETLMNDLNGGARVDPTAGIMNKMIGLSKKAAVLASASVVVQQPSAIFRAMALVDAKYFVGKPSATRHKNTWAEVKKYAPVAIIKEMGYFDTGMGQSTVEWLKGDKSIKDKVDDVLSKAPALADELTWCAIWKAVKRETLANNKNLDPNSEEFLKKCGERFTEVVTETQVYDSVLARSGMMRSKDTGMKMATAFMAEPTTSLNMIINAIVQGKRGNKRLAAKAVSAVAVATIVNSALVSLVYAARDDDEDETYLEKYIGSVTTELIDGFNPLTYVPFVKDIWSIFQGYDVERSDMSLISDLWQSFENLFGEGTAYDKVSGVAGALASVLGVPLKNILRDAEGTYNFFKTITSGTPTTGAGIRDTIIESAKDAIPLWGRFSESKSTSDKLYEAIMSGDTDQIERLKSQYDSQDKIDSAIRTGLRENDPRITEAAQARYDGNIAEYKRIAKEIIAEGNFSQDIVVGAINAAVNAIKKGETTETEQTGDKDEATSIYKASDVNAAFESGDNTMALEIIEDLVKTKVENGKTEKEAKSSVRSSMTSYWKPLYLEAYKSGNSAEMQRIRKILYASGLYGNGNEVVKTVQGWLKD